MDSKLPTPADLTAEKNLWQIFRVAIGMKSSGFNVWFTIAALLFFSMEVAIGKENYLMTADFVRSFVVEALSIGLSVLAFLLAGFAVFTAMTEKSLFAAKALTLEPESNVSWLKRDMFLVVRTFCYLIAYVALCVVGVAMTRKGGVGHLLASAIGGEDVRHVFVSVAYVFLMTSTVFIVLQVKSFVFNVVHLSLSSVRWELEKPRLDPDPKPAAADRSKSGRKRNRPNLGPTGRR